VRCLRTRSDEGLTRVEEGSSPARGGALWDGVGCLRRSFVVVVVRSGRRYLRIHRLSAVLSSRTCCLGGVVATNFVGEAIGCYEA
jgi:hypothetical protein